MCETANTALTLMFCGEIFCKLLAFSTYGFWSDPFNIFDVVIVFFGILELVSNFVTSLNAFRAFRIFRGLRLLRMVEFFQPMQLIVVVIINTLADLAGILLLMLLFIFTFAVLGMQLFSGDVASDEVVHGLSYMARGHYNSFGVAFLTTFQVITYDEWHIVMYDVIRQSGDGAIVFFLVWITIGALVLVNLLFVVILTSFVEESNAAKKNAQEKEDAANLGSPDHVIAVHDPSEVAFSNPMMDMGTFEDEDTVGKTATFEVSEDKESPDYKGTPVKFSNPAMSSSFGDDGGPAASFCPCTAVVRRRHHHRRPRPCPRPRHGGAGIALADGTPGCNLRVRRT